MAQKARPPVVSIVFVGDEQVGKTSILQNFMDGIFRDNLDRPSIFRHRNVKQMEIDGSTVNLYPWDGAQRIRFGTNKPNIWYSDVDGVILVYDVTKRTTFQNLEYWLEVLDSSYSGRKIPPKIIVGNKTDLPNREVGTEEGMKFAEKHQDLYAECSPKLAQGVTGVFEKLVRKIIQRLGVPRMLGSGNQTAVGGARNGLGNPGIDSRVDDQPQEVPLTWCNIS